MRKAEILRWKAQGNQSLNKHLAEKWSLRDFVSQPEKLWFDFQYVMCAQSLTYYRLETGKHLKLNGVIFYKGGIPDTIPCSLVEKSFTNSQVVH